MNLPDQNAREEMFLRLPTVRARTGKSKGAIYADIADGRFPRPVKIGRRAVAWPSSAIDEWMRGVVAVVPTVADVSALAPGAREVRQ